MSDPTLTPIRAHSDDRRTAWLELLGPLLPGDLTVTWVHPDAILGWHQHHHQDDYMVVVAGVLKVGTWEECYMGPGELEPYAATGPRWFTLDARNPQVLHIPKGQWHGYQSIGDASACVVTYTSQHYDPSDEYRKPVGAWPYFDFTRMAR